MTLDTLLRYGVPPTLINAWRARQGDTLLPVQVAAIRQGILDDNGPVATLISAPTSAGKSFCGELALGWALTHRAQGILAVPLKSIAEEQYAQFASVCLSLGRRPLIATADHPENDAALERGEFDIAVCVYEKFNRLLIANADILACLGVVVIDELHLLADPERGHILESALIKIAAYRKCANARRPRVIGLSAVLSGTDALAEWLSCDAGPCRVIRETHRPVELRHGVIWNGRFEYRSVNTGAEGSENLPAIEPMVSATEPMISATEPMVSATEPGLSDSADSADSSEQFLRLLCDTSGQKLVFVASRRRAVDAALRLASIVNWPRAAGTLDRLTGEEPSHLTRALCQSLTRGVAFHSADLTAVQRRVIEDGYRAGEIDTLFCTTTLAMGVNLPADFVLIEAMKYDTGLINSRTGGPRGSRPQLAPISRAEFINIAGRAGRYVASSNGARMGSTGAAPDKKSVDVTHPVARAAALAESEFDRDTLWAAYIESAPEIELVSALAAGSTERWATVILDWIAAGFAGASSGVTNLALSALAVRTHGARVTHKIERALGALRASGAVVLTGAEYTVTDSGRAAALAGLGVATAGEFMRIAKDHHPTSDDIRLAVVISARDFGSAIGPFAAVARAREVEHELHAVASERSCEGACGAHPGVGGAYPGVGGAYPSVQSVMAALAGFPEGGLARSLRPSLAARALAWVALTLWREGTPAQVIEERTQVSIGAIGAAGETAAHLVAAFRAIGRAGDPDFDCVETFGDLAFSLRVGLPARMRGMWTEIGPPTGCFNRAELMELNRMGLVTPEMILAAPARDIVAALSRASIGHGVTIHNALARLQKQSATANVECSTGASVAKEETSVRQTSTPSTLTKASVASTLKPMAPAALGRNGVSVPLRSNIRGANSGAGGARPNASGVIGTHSSRPHRFPGAMTTKSPVATRLRRIPARLEIDGMLDGERFLVKIDGVAALLTGKSFKYLVRLAAARLTRSEGWLYKDDLEVGFNQARYLYRLRQEIDFAVPGCFWDVYENNRLGSYRLAVDPGAVEINVSALSASDDFEVRQVAESLIQWQMTSQSA